MDIELQFKLLNDKLNKYLNDLEKSNKKNKLIRGCVFFILLLILFSNIIILFVLPFIPRISKVIDANNDMTKLMMYTAINVFTIGISMVLASSVFYVMSVDYSEHINAVHNLLAEHLNVSVKSVEFELNAFIHGMKTKQGLDIISDFYTDLDQFMLVYEKLAKNLKKDITESKMQDLRVEQAQLNVQKTELQNESIKIDNDLKNFWECKYCGAANYGNEKTCTSCGATRLVIKLKSRNEV